MHFISDGHDVGFTASGRVLRYHALPLTPPCLPRDSCRNALSSYEDLYSLSSFCPPAVVVAFRSFFRLSREVQTLSMPPELAAKAGGLLAPEGGGGGGRGGGRGEEREGGGRNISAAAAAAEAALSRQSLVRLINVWTNEEIIFNGLRSRRPNFDGGAETAKIQRRKFEAILAEAETKPCDFCRYEKATAFDGGGKKAGVVGGRYGDPFRLENEKAASFTNAFPFSGWQVVVVPKKHSALELGVDDVEAMADIFDEWFASVADRDPDRCCRRPSRLALFDTCVEMAGAGGMPHFCLFLLLLSFWS